MVNHQFSKTFVSAFVTLVTLAIGVCSLPVQSQDMESDPKAKVLIRWLNEDDGEKGFIDFLRSKLNQLTAFFVWITSPDIPPESRHLWIISVDGDNKRLLSKDAGVKTPRWGRSGFIVYVVESDENGDGYIDFYDTPAIKIISDSGGESRTIGPGLSPVWSPDGMHIAFLREGEIWIHTLDSQTLPLGQTQHQGQLVFTNHLTPSKADEFWAMDMKNKASHELTPIPGKKHWWLSALSNSGDQIVFPNLQRTDIFVRHAEDGAQNKNVTDDEFLDMDPAWSPDDEFIVYVSDAPIDNY